MRKTILLLSIIIFLMITAGGGIRPSSSRSYIAGNSVYALYDFNFESNEPFTIESWGKMHNSDSWDINGRWSLFANAHPSSSKGIIACIFQLSLENNFRPYVYVGDSVAAFDIISFDYGIYRTEHNIFDSLFYFTVSVYPESALIVFNDSIKKQNERVTMDKTYYVTLGPYLGYNYSSDSGDPEKLQIMGYRIYNRSLDRNELLYNSTNNKAYSDSLLIFDWESGDPVSENYDTLYDQSGNNNNAIIKGTGDWQVVPGFRRKQGQCK